MLSILQRDLTCRAFWASYSHHRGNFNTKSFRRNYLYYGLSHAFIHIISSQQFDNLYNI